MKDLLWEHFPAIAMAVLLIVCGVLLLSIFGRFNEIHSIEYECLSYGYPQFRAGSGSEPSYCVRRIFDVDEVRTLDELRAKEKTR